MPALLNLANGGQSWREHGITCARVMARIGPPMKTGCPALWAYMEERLDEIIGQAHTQLRQCTCQGAAQARGTSGPAPRGVLTVLPGAWQTSPSWAPRAAEEQDAEE